MKHESLSKYHVSEKQEHKFCVYTELANKQKNEGGKQLYLTSLDLL